ncbi:porin [Moraxella nasovis]|uniref:porin n=1 Tax=Moraxella nasovis TaxID=2904121 RepID=UPI001F61E185|nr:porin [Moraxella nasovis]UNU72626.1 porin [Moraxella nasovis]
MKKSPLAIAIKTTSVLAIAALSSQAFAAPDLYGQIRLSALAVDKTDTINDVATKTSARPDLSSGNSRIGIKGTEKLTDNTDLEYKLEYKVDVAENTGGNFSARHGYIALNNKQYGRLLVGRTISQDDYLSVSPAWWRNVGIGPVAGHDATWVNNSILYTTPKLNNGTTTAFIQYGMDEGSGAAGKGSRSFSTFKNNKETSLDRDFVIGGVQYAKDKVALNAAYTHAGKDLKSIRGSAEYKANDRLTVYGLAQLSDYNSNNDELAVSGGASYKINAPITAWAEAYHTDNYKGYADGKASGFNIGAQYDINKSLLAFASVGYAQDKYWEWDKKPEEIVVKNKIEKKTIETFNKKENTSKGIEVGMVYRF